MLECKQADNQFNAEPDCRDCRAFTQHVKTIKWQLFPPGGRHWPHIGFTFSRHRALLSVVSG